MVIFFPFSTIWKRVSVHAITCGLCLLAGLFLSFSPIVSMNAEAYTLWSGYHEDRQTEVWINPNCRDASAGSPADQIRSILGGDLEGGLDSWKEQAGSGWLGFCYMGITDVQLVNLNDGINAIYWRAAPGNGSLALTYSDGDTVDNGFDIVFFDGDVTWSSDENPQQTDIKGVATHESGHALGLGHSQYYESTMWAYLKGNGENNRFLATDDNDGMRFLYGIGFPGAEYCTFGTQGSYHDTCNLALDLGAGGTIDGENIWADDDYDFGNECAGHPLPGPDVVYRVWLETNEHLVVTVYPETLGFDPALTLFSGCGIGIMQCLVGEDGAGSGSVETLEYLALESGEYFLAVDSRYAEGLGSCGLFTLDALITYENPSTVRVAMDCSPEVGLLPFNVQLDVELVNLADQYRTMFARISLVTGNGLNISNIRSGQIDLGPKETFTRSLTLNLPLVNSLDGINTFRFFGEDVTAGDPLPAAGDWAEDFCTVSASME